MKKLILLICFLIVGGPLFSQEWHPNIHIQRTNLIVHWKTPKYVWPKVVGIYHASPTQFAPNVVSNLLSLGGFTEKDRWYSSTDGVSYHASSNRTLRISYREGEVHYENPDWNHYSVTNLAQGVPEPSHLFHETTNFLPMLGISISEISKKGNGKTDIYYPEVLSGFPGAGPHGEFLTNIWYRIVRFHRNLNGGKLVYQGGECELNFGEHGRVTKIDLTWPDLKCDQLYAAATSKELVQRIRQGKALQRHMYDAHGEEYTIDWQSVKGLTITNAQVVYMRGETFFAREFAPKLITPDLVYPDAELSGTVDIGSEKVRVEIVCPVMDETRPLLSGDARN